MSLNVREFDMDTDSTEVSNWWTRQDWDASTINVISKTGFIVEDNNQKLVATWVIKTNSPIYLLEWTVGNPEVSWEKRNEAIQKITEYAGNWAKEDGAKALMIMTKNKRYIEKLKNNNFIESDKDMVHLVRCL